MGRVGEGSCGSLKKGAAVGVGGFYFLFRVEAFIKFYAVQLCAVSVSDTDVIVNYHAVRQNGGFQVLMASWCTTKLYLLPDVSALPDILYPFRSGSKCVVNVVKAGTHSEMTYSTQSHLGGLESICFLDADEGLGPRRDLSCLFVWRGGCLAASSTGNPVSALSSVRSQCVV